MTTEEIKQKYQIDSLAFRRVLNEKKQETKWLSARKHDKSVVFMLHDYDAENLRTNPKRSDIITSSLRKYSEKENVFYTAVILSLSGFVMNVKLHEEEKTVTIIPNLKKVNLDRVSNFEDEYHKQEQNDILGFVTPQVREKIALDFDVDFEIDTFKWKIPYVIVLEKIYSKTNSAVNLSFRKCRARLQLFSEIAITNEKLHPFLIQSLLLLDRMHIDWISKSQFENQFDNKVFLFNNDLRYNSNSDCIYIVSLTFYQSAKENTTNFSFNDDEQIMFKGNKFKKGELVNGYYYLNIFPIGFYDSYLEKIIDNDGRIPDIHHYSPLDISIEGTNERFNTPRAQSKGERLFQGTHEYCVSFLNNEQNIHDIKTRIHENNNKLYKEQLANDSFDYYNRRGWESDYFDTMTDGQMGSYDDFIENGGDMDNL